jgi:hypothetical protein
VIDGDVETAAGSGIEEAIQAEGFHGRGDGSLRESGGGGQGRNDETRMMNDDGNGLSESCELRIAPRQALGN